MHLFAQLAYSLIILKKEKTIKTKPDLPVISEGIVAANDMRQKSKKYKENFYGICSFLGHNLPI